MHFVCLCFIFAFSAIVYGPVNLPSHRNSNGIMPSVQTEMYLKVFERYLNEALLTFSS